MIKQSEDLKIFQAFRYLVNEDIECTLHYDYLTNLFGLFEKGLWITVDKSDVEAGKLKALINVTRYKINERKTFYIITVDD